MARQIDLRPTVLNLVLYSGDGFTIKLACTDTDGAPVDITGSVIAEVRADRLHPNDPALATFSVSMVDAYLGVVAVSLTATQTDALLTDGLDKFTGVWDVQWIPTNKEPLTLVQGSVECVADVTQ
jgi:hypothetical protein